MSLKMKLVSMISAFVLVIGMLLIGVFAVERVQVDMGGSITFNADDVYAKVTGSVEKAQVAPEGLDVTYSAYETTGNPTAWESLDLEFDSYATPIVISITVENLSTERSLTVNLTDALTSSVPNLGKELKRDNSAYTSGTNIPLDPKDNGTSTTTFTITLSVLNRNQSLTNAQFDYDLNLYDENYKFPEVYDYFTFSDNGDETVTLTGFNAGLADGKTDIVIPATVSQNADGQWIDGDDYTVVGIADGYYDDEHNVPSEGVFLRNTTITSVVLPDTIKYIGECAFTECSNLTSITLAEGLTSIGEQAFRKCTGLTSITLPEGLTSIGDSTFFYCSGLTSITLAEGLTSIGEEAFAGCSGLENITLPEGLISIGELAFAWCDGLTSISLPDSLTSIGSHAFDGCSNLQPSITDQGVKYLGSKQNPYLVLWDGTDITTSTYTVNEICKFIDSYAFYYCDSLTSITLPEGLTSIGSSAFSGCSNLQPSITDQGVKYLGNEQNSYLVLWDGTAITSSSYTVNPDCKIICYDAFSGCDVLTSITLPEGLTSIGEQAFRDCTSLTTIDLDQCTSLTSIGSSAFDGCSNLTTVDLYQCTSLTSIGEQAFRDCTNLITVDLDQCISLTSIGEQAFRDCTNLITVDLDQCISLTSIGNYAFQYCDGLTSITLPDSLTSIGGLAFTNCTSLTSITLPSSLRSIGNFAFQNCYALAEVYNYSSLNLTIGSAGNDYVAQYARVVYNLSDGEEKPATRIQTIDNMQYYVYGDDFIALAPTSRDITSINLDSQTIEINRGAFYNYYSLTSITLPSNLTSIGDRAFSGCSGLKEVIIDSEDVYNSATSTSACGSLFNNSSITTVKVLTSLDDGTNSYITTNFTKGPTEVIGGKSYTVYSK